RATAFAVPVEPEVGTTSAVRSNPAGSCAGGSKGPSHSRARPSITSPIAWACAASEAAEPSWAAGTSHGRSTADGACVVPGPVISALRVREPGAVGLALLEERVAALGGLVGHVCQARRLPGEDLLTHQPVVGEVKANFSIRIACGDLVAI